MKDKSTSKVGQEFGTGTQRKRPNELEFTPNSTSVSDGRGKIGQEGMVGYVQSVSPPKQSQQNTEYSNFKLQCKSAMIPGYVSRRRSAVSWRSVKPRKQW